MWKYSLYHERYDLNWAQNNLQLNTSKHLPSLSGRTELSLMAGDRKPVLKADANKFVYEIMVIYFYQFPEWKKKRLCRKDP